MNMSILVVFLRSYFAIFSHDVAVQWACPVDVVCENGEDGEFVEDVWCD